MSYTINDVFIIIYIKCTIMSKSHVIRYKIQNVNVYIFIHLYLNSIKF